MSSTVKLKINTIGLISAINIDIIMPLPGLEALVGTGRHSSAQQPALRHQTSLFSKLKDKL